MIPTLQVSNSYEKGPMTTAAKTRFHAVPMFHFIRHRVVYIKLEF